MFIYACYIPLAMRASASHLKRLRNQPLRLFPLYTQTRQDPPPEQIDKKAYPSKMKNPTSPKACKAVSQTDHTGDIEKAKGILWYKHRNLHCGFNSLQ